MISMHMRIFLDTFGFKEYQDPDNYNQGVYLSIEQSTPINITGYDTFVQTDIYMSDQNRKETIFDIEKDGKKYTLLRDFKEDQMDLTLMGENNRSLFDLRHKKSMISFTIIIQ